MDKVYGLCSLEVLIKRCSSPRKSLDAYNNHRGNNLAGSSRYRSVETNSFEAGIRGTTWK